MPGQSALVTGRAMRSRVEIVARSDGGRTVLPRLRAEGQLAVRQTAAGVVHLVSIAAGPIGGDLVEIDVTVEAGARLELRSAAAALVLPGRHDPFSRTLLSARVGDGARLRVGLEPTVVACRAQHSATTRVRVSGSGRLHLIEQLVLGRHGEEPGRWAGRTLVDVDERPVLRHTVRSSTLLLEGGRGYLAEVLIGPEVEPVTAAGERSVTMPLAAGGRLLSAWGPDLSSARAAAQPSPSRAANSEYPTNATVSSRV